MHCRMEKLKRNKIQFAFITLIMSVIVFAQPNPNSDKIDGVAAVVGDEIVLNSDILRDYEIRKQQYGEDIDLCTFMDNTLLQKMVLHHAKIDTLVEVSSDRIRERTQQVVADFRSRGSDEEILKVYGVRTIAELQTEIEIMVRENELIQAKQGRIQSNIDASPEDVRKFYEMYKNDLPQVPEEVAISHIVIYPEITEAHKLDIQNQLNSIKKEILEGASFETKAILYSEDPGSSNEGGLYKNIKRGTFVPEFDAVAFNLEEGEISEPVETEFGWHLIKLEKRLGQAIDVRHILITAKPTAEEIATTMTKMDTLRQRILNKETTFEEAAKTYSEDKYTKFNGGVMTHPQTGEDRFERSKLDTKKIYALAGLSEGDITEPYEGTYNNKVAVEMMRLNTIVPAHQITMETDYTRLTNFTEREKQQEVLYKWVQNNLKDTFVKIDDDYMTCDYQLNWKKL